MFASKDKQGLPPVPEHHPLPPRPGAGGTTPGIPSGASYPSPIPVHRDAPPASPQPVHHQTSPQPVHLPNPLPPQPAQHDSPSNPPRSPQPVHRDTPMPSPQLPHAPQPVSSHPMMHPQPAHHDSPSLPHRDTPMPSPQLPHAPQPIHHDSPQPTSHPSPVGSPHPPKAGLPISFHGADGMSPEQQSNQKGRDVYVGLDRDDHDRDGKVAHFGIGQALVWEEYGEMHGHKGNTAVGKGIQERLGALKQEVFKPMTLGDSDYAQRLALEEQLDQENHGRKPASTLSDSDFALALQAEMSGPSHTSAPVPHVATLNDSDFARSLMEEDRQHQPRSHNPLSDSVLARQLQDELNAGN